RRRDFTHEIASGHRRGLAGEINEVVGVASADAAVLGAMVAQMAGESSCVDPANCDDVLSREIVSQGLLTAVVGNDRAGVTNDKSCCHRGGGGALRILCVDSSVPDVRRGHRHDLRLEGGISEDFLVASHASGEDDLPGRLAIGTKAETWEKGAVGESKGGWL